MTLQDQELGLLMRVAVGGETGAGERAGELVELRVTGCAYSCCGKGWRRRDGYEQTYWGYIDNLQLPHGEAQGTLMLYSTGVGTISYVIAARFSEILDVLPYEP